VTANLLTVDVRYEQDVVLTRQRARQIAALLDLNVNEQTAFATSVSELVRNAFRYAGHGRVTFSLRADGQRQALLVRVQDQGPGIADLPAILEGRYRSQTGMGLGLLGSKRLNDEFEIESTPAAGTTVTIGKWLPKRSPAITPQFVAGLATDLAQRAPRNAVEEVQEQNKELLRALDELRVRQAEVERLNAELERAGRMKDDFLGTLSHELRTPLTPVLLAVTLLEADPSLPQSARDDMAMIRRNVELESRLIGDLLDVTRISKGKLQLDEQEIDLHATIRSAVDVCRRDGSAALVVELNATRQTIRGDGTRLEQVFWNLVSNALKFTPATGTVRVRSYDADDGGVCVEVSDDGAGIDPLVLPKLFTAFEQGEVRGTQRAAGLGLGLAISLKLVEAHGGRITARSEGRGAGATFLVGLSALRICAPAAPVQSGDEPLPESQRPLSVLLVEDHEATLRLMTRLLRQLGHQVTAATTVASAAAAARQQRFDVLLSDLGLPDGSGLDLMRELRADYGDRSVALSGYGMDKDVAASRAAGFAEHLTKPFEVHQLVATLSRVSTRRGESNEPSAGV
jgi:signal transduction histidine kinase/ActR/RegA family two-component response regulator